MDSQIVSWLEEISEFERNCHGTCQAIYDHKVFYRHFKYSSEEPNFSLCTSRTSIFFKEGGQMQYMSLKEKQAHEKRVFQVPKVTVQRTLHIPL